MTESWSYGEEAEPRAFPWPPPQDGGALAAFGETWKSATLDPGTFFERMPAAASIGPAVLYYLIIGILTAGVGLFWDLTGVFTGAAGNEAMAAELGIGTIDPLVGFLLSPLVLLLALLLAAGVTHVLLLVFGGARNGFGTTIRVFCYAYSPMIFGVVPVLGSLVGSIWMLVLAIIGLRESHRTDGWKAALAVILPVVMILGLLFMTFMLMAAAGAALLSL